MSSICGYFDVSGNLICSQISSVMMEQLEAYQSGTSGFLKGERFFFGCRHQVITPESQLENLPYLDEPTGLSITADAIIDNRDELLSSFHIAPVDWITFCDAQIILMAYQKWGKECPKYLIGDYAFAIFDQNRNELFCARDHVGKRTLYYSYESGIFAFCTLMKPLQSIPGVNQTLNDQWLADFLAIQFITHEIDSTHTVYKNIYQLLPAHSLTLNGDGLKKYKFWDPLELPEIRFKKDSEYVDAFLEVYSEAVSCRTRSLGSVGVMLSGGLDSGSVACLAAKKLHETGKNLKAFSSVPMEGYIDWLPAHRIANESDYIQAIAQQYPNIEVMYCRAEGKNSYSEIDRLMEILEQPNKIVENLYWIDNIAEIASKENCSVLLDGQFGNATVSYGDFYMLAFSLLKQAKIFSLYQEITDYCRTKGISRKRMGKYLAQRFLPQFMPSYLFRQKTRHTEDNRNKGLALINQNFALQFNTSSRLAKAGISQEAATDLTLEEYRRQTIESSVFSHMAAMETKMSLKYSLVRRDPTRDKRVIDFCFRIPLRQYVQKGQDRLLLRRSMTGIMPEQVRLNNRVKGLQSADWLQRIDPIWGGIKKEIQELVMDKNIGSYIDSDVVLQLFERNKNILVGETNEIEIRQLIIFVILGRFLNKSWKEIL